MPEESEAVAGERGMNGSDGAKENAEAAAKLKIRVSEVPGGRGVRVDDIQSENVRDLAPGDIIVELNNMPIADVAGLQTALAAVKPGTTALLKVRRGKHVQYAAVPVGGK